MAESLSGQSTQTSFDEGIARFTWLMLRFILVMVPLVFVINGVTKGNCIAAKPRSAGSNGLLEVTAARPPGH
jgi:Mg2+-importing ATPase